MSTETGVPARPAGGPVVERAYDTCRRMQRRQDPTYYWATRCLPAERRRAVHALYGFVRGADDIADGADRADGRRAALDAWQTELEHGLLAGRSDHRVIGHPGIRCVQGPEEARSGTHEPIIAAPAAPRDGPRSWR